MFFFQVYSLRSESLLLFADYDLKNEDQKIQTLNEGIFEDIIQRIVNKISKWYTEAGRKLVHIKLH